jgi:fatty-acyl-CoA synthase
VNRFMTALIDSAHHSDRGLVAGEPENLCKTTWYDIHRQARQVAGGLRKAGVERGDAVAVLAGAAKDIAPLVQGIWLAGASVTMLHQPTPRTDIPTWLSDTQRALEVISARAIVVGTPFEATVSAFHGMPTKCIPVEQLRNGDDMDPVYSVDDDIAFLQFTSGSTGKPKAVAISYRNMYANLRAMEFASRIRIRHDVMISWLPLFHDMGMMGFLVGPMFIGAEVVSISPMDFLNAPLLWAELVTKYQGSMSAAPNFAYALLARRLARADDGAYDLSSLRFVLSGAEPIDVAVVERFLSAGERFGLSPEAIIPAYGMAEATLAVSFVRPGEKFKIDHVDPTSMQTCHRAIGSRGEDAHRYMRLGRLLPGFEAKIVTDSGAIGSNREVGEICLRGESIAAGYRTDVGYIKATDAEGWLATGDVGYMTEDAQLVICGRRKDMLIISGRNVYPVDIERAAARVEGVRAGNTAAVRMSNSGSSEGFAVIVESIASADQGESHRIEREVASRVFQEMGVSPRCVRVVGIGCIPKTPSGKLRRIEAQQLVGTDTSHLANSRPSAPGQQPR